MSGPAEGSGGGLVGWFTRNSVAANLLMILFLAGGVVSLFNIRTQVFPDLPAQIVQIAVPYPGATPEDVEESITRRVEEAVLGIDGVDRVRSRAQEGYGSVTVELLDFADPQRVKDDVETAVDSIVQFPPEDAEEPQILVPQVTTDVVTLAVVGEVGERRLRETAEQLERDILTLPNVSTVGLRGVRDYQIDIQVSETALRRLNLTFNDVANAVRQSSIDLSGGSIRTDSGQILLRTDARKEAGEEFGPIIVRSDPNGSLIRLEDVATIIDGFEDDSLISQFNGRPAAFVDVKKGPSEDLLGVRAAVSDFLETYQPPAGVDVVLADDETTIFQERLSLLMRNAILGFVLVLLLLVLMLDLRLAFWVAMGVPISFLGGLMIFTFIGGTLNFITTFGLIVVLGIVVDDAIVVGENTDRQYEKGYSPSKAAFEGVKGVAAPVLIGVLTTMAAFGPLIFSGGTFGQITRPIPIIVISILTISLVEAFFILPSHLSHGANWSQGPLATLQRRIAGALAWFAQNVIARWARAVVKMRYAAFVAGIGAVIVAFSLATTGIVRFVFFPTIEAPNMSANLALPDGAPFEATERAARQIADAAEQVARDYESEFGRYPYNSVTLTIGGRTSEAGGPGEVSQTTVASNLAQVEIELIPTSERPLASAEMERRWREAVGRVPGAETLTFSSSFTPGGADVAYELAHPDNEALTEAVIRLRDALEAMEGVNEVDDGYDIGKRQLEFELTQAGEAAGLRPADIGRQVRQAYFGEEVQRIQRGREEVRVFVRYPEDARRSLATLDELRVRTPDGAQLPLSVVATSRESRTLTAIDRVDGRRIVEVTADVEEAVTTPNAVNSQIQNEILPAIIADYPELRWRQGGAGREQAEDFASLGRGLMVALLVMFALLATQLKSYLQPVIILLAVPFGLAGAILGHAVLGYDLSFPSIFGMVALSGVVVNASIVLIDRVNQNMSAGEPLDEAIAEATARRFRPILITTLTTALGLLPIMAETSPQAQFLVPMAVSLGAGLLFASTLIILLLPAYIAVIQDVRNGLNAVFGGGRSQASGPDASA